MKANIPKQPAPPKPWQNLPPHQRKQITDYALGIANDQLNKDTRLMLDLYIKMDCCILHDACGMTEEELLCFLGSHKQFFRRQMKMVADDTQIQYLNDRMAEIFPTNGFPQQFFDGMFGEVELPGGEEKEVTDERN